MPTLNYTTQVPVVRTLAEIQALLARHGAASVAVDYREERPVGVAFSLGDRLFVLPVNVAAVQALLARQKAGNSRVTATPEQAARVAWRVVKDWLLAQLALIEAGQASLDQVMLPYLQVSPGRTLYDEYRQRELAAR